MTKCEKCGGKVLAQYDWMVDRTTFLCEVCKHTVKEIGNHSPWKRERAKVPAQHFTDVKSIEAYDLVKHLYRQTGWSRQVFGPGPRTEGLVNHIRKECDEILEDPKDIEEWIDVVILALDGAWREGYTPEEIAAALLAKQEKNERRKWPDWRTVPAGAPIEHDRSYDDDADRHL
jgi:hypothetical protein